ncbi:MAG: hypothetical protein NTU72_09070, partial [Fimbriimonadales bacterium]|nr:hypothetical protein [Fimbriimonadales bacterium]
MKIKGMSGVILFGLFLMVVAIVEILSTSSRRHNLNTRISQLDIVGKSVEESRSRLKSIGLGLNPVNLRIGQDESSCDTFDCYPDQPKFTVLPLGMTRTRIVVRVEESRV